MIAQQVNAERIVLLGWARAILLQMAHPLIAAGVVEHSAFRGGALAAAGRLHHTVRAMLRLCFGDDRTVAGTVAGIQAIHRRVHGELRDATGPFAAGHPYSAEDPALLLWVHATLIESVIGSYEQFIAPLSAAERDQYCDEAAGVAIALGARADEVPRTWAALARYVERVHASGVLAVGHDARLVARAVLHPPLRPLTAPAGWIMRLITAADLPAPIRAQYGLRWSDSRARQHAWVVRGVRALRRVVPDRFAQWPEARAGARPDAREAAAGLAPGPKPHESRETVIRRPA